MFVLDCSWLNNVGLLLAVLIGKGSFATILCDVFELALLHCIVSYALGTAIKLDRA
jgi:hypothetical protein